jgi:hypothetical protein
MKRFVLAALAVLLAWLGLSAAPAAAQNIYPYQAPRYGPGWQTPLSPYLNMLIPGNAAVNYYALVEPQFQRRQYRNQLNQTLQSLMNQFPEPPGINPEDFNAPLQSTGHPSAFNYTGSYFNSTQLGQPIVSPYARRMGAGAGMMGAGARPMGMGGMGMGGMGMGGMGMGAGVWPNMRPGMGPLGR